MLQRRSGARRLSRGQAFVEFAIILPVFLMLTLGVVDMARVFTTYISLTNAVREGALFLSQGVNTVAQWCDSSAPVAEIQCTDLHPTTSSIGSGNPNSDPENMAYHVYVETILNGLPKSNLVLNRPVCASASDFSTIVTCDSSARFVKLSASYTVTLVTPVLSGIFGNGVTVSAQTIAQVIQ
jgi:Flp pilus assembly protein TadG